MLTLKKNDWNGSWGEGLMLLGSFLSFPPLTSFLFLQDILFLNTLNIHYSWAWELESEGQKERQGRRMFKSQGASESPRDSAEIQVPGACPRDPDLACLWGEPETAFPTSSQMMLILTTHGPSSSTAPRDGAMALSSTAPGDRAMTKGGQRHQSWVLWKHLCFLLSVPILVSMWFWKDP